ncbi:hypothetical protein BMETH_670_1 [methanotrophic bacterial endosymbiont of Bathymodiolus sp.]|nr:hypothetical protein BMETH_670_1 [methanotrophic bacterial endosymbiont of Bathymodiolus sp.]
MARLRGFFFGRPAREPLARLAFRPSFPLSVITTSRAGLRPALAGALRTHRQGLRPNTPAHPRQNGLQAFKDQSEGFALVALAARPLRSPTRVVTVPLSSPSLSGT